MSRSEVDLSTPVLIRTAALVGAALCLMSMTLVQFGAAFSAPIMDEIGSVATTWLRLCWAAVILAIVARPRLLSYSRRQWQSALLLGLAIAMMTLLFFEAIQRIPLGLTVAVEFLGPLAVAAFGLRRGWALLWPVVALVGVVLLVRVGEGQGYDLVGLAFAAGAGVGWGSYIILTKRIGTAFAGLEGLAMSIIAAAILTTPFGLVALDGAPAPHILLETGGLAFLTPLLPYAFELIALRRLSTSAFGVLMSLEPALGAFAGFIVLHQPMTPLQLLGTACVIAASAGATLMHK